ncbi:hypothetical protein QFZ30_004209 [Arthrobacter pascens]|uniref:hypothetical protein n=1 Tax=Arthrobacter pascens TaxID=1677 RepID=UPI0027936F4B|nr:hypothetical protein [Arthrobacter pascens]MDQ0680827.1 hypothetical protein [Arthrobacter pascens]
MPDTVGHSPAEVTAVVPARNAEHMLPLVDSDVVFGPTGVADLLTELVEGGHDALQDAR